MLVLSRKEHERIMIGDDIVITLVRLGPIQARIGIDAPKHLIIRREELGEMNRSLSQESKTHEGATADGSSNHEGSDVPDRTQHSDAAPKAESLPIPEHAGR